MIPNAWLLNLRTNQSYQIQRPDTWIGRSTNNQLVIADDPSVSNVHARLIYKDGAFILYDQGASVHIQINGVVLVAPQQINHDDRILFGQTWFKFVRS